MSERDSTMPAPAPARPRVLPLALPAWLRERLLPGAENSLQLAAYAMVLAALLTTVAARRPGADLPAWRFYATVLTLAALLAVELFASRIGRRLGAEWAYLPFGVALFLLASALDGIRAPFIPYLMFMLTAEAFIELRVRWALVCTAIVTGGWLALVWAWHGHGLDALLQQSVGIGSGVLFSALFAVTVKAFGVQTERAHELLAEVEARDAALSAAREREKDLAVAEERVRLAREIHDGLGHHLTVLNIQLQAAEKLLQRDPGRAAEAVAICRGEAQAALDEVRHSVAAMRRTPLDGRPLHEALALLVLDFDRRSSLRASFAREGTPLPLPPAAEATLYRAAQEGLTNAQKHAAASRVAVTLAYTPSGARVTVEDDGAGGEQGGDGFGLAGLRERAEQLGGTFSANRLEGAGFKLELSVPAVSSQPSAISGQPPAPGPAARLRANG